MKNLVVDVKKRVRIPDATPGHVYRYLNNGDGSITLTRVKPPAKEPFPRGSLLKYLTPERDKETLELLKGCSLKVPD